MRASVVPSIAESTTAQRSLLAAWRTSETTCSIASASRTEEPPNFRTFISYSAEYRGHYRNRSQPRRFSSLLSKDRGPMRVSAPACQLSHLPNRISPGGPFRERYLFPPDTGHPPEP